MLKMYTIKTNNDLQLFVLFIFTKALNNHQKLLSFIIINNSSDLLLWNFNVVFDFTIDS